MDGSEWGRAGANRAQEAIQARFRRLETGAQVWVDHQRRAMKKTCIGARNQSGVGDFPRSVTPFCDAFTLAMNIPIKRANRMRDVVRPMSLVNSSFSHPHEYMLEQRLLPNK